MFGQGRISALYGRKYVSKPTVAVDTAAVDTVFADVSVIDVESCFVHDQLPIEEEIWRIATASLRSSAGIERVDVCGMASVLPQIIYEVLVFHVKY